MASEIAAGLRRATKEMHGIVVSAGFMDKTVKVRLGGQRWEQRVHKTDMVLKLCVPTESLTPPVLLPGPQWFKAPRFKLVHDPANSLRQGDVVAITPSWRESQHVRHVVKHIIAPCGPAIEARPPIPSMEERAAERIAKRVAKDERRALARCVENATLATTATGNLVRDVQKVLARVGAPPPL
ncbi:hypothetical protein F4824DRAFT_498635 [Ustulina deusta]|nr:hypothetical protein F4824DRAFT_498635 [Ustulina deusta]